MNQATSVGNTSHRLPPALALMLCAGIAFGAAPPTQPDPQSDASQSLMDPEESTLSLQPRGWGRPVRIMAMWENDSSAAKVFDTTDRYYTNGLRFDIAWRPDWAHDAARALPFGEPLGESPRAAFGLAVQHKIFTPRDVDAREPLPDDHPYAGWLSFSAYLQRSAQINDHIAMADHLELDMGIVGSWTGAEQLQNNTHRLFGFDTVKGWDNQLANEFTINLTLRRKWRFTTGPDDKGYEFQFIPEVGAIAGTVYRQLESSATLRWGINLPDDFGPSRIADANIATGGWEEDSGFYLFVRAGGRAVEHNLFLDGNTFANSQSVSKNPLVGEIHFGLVVLLCRNFEIGWSQTYATQDFKTQKGDPAFGALILSWRCEF